MPYESIKAAKDAKFPTTADKVPLTLAQINHLARIYDAIKKAGSADNPMAVSWTQWKDIYEKKDDKWVLKEEQKGVSEAFVDGTPEPEWLPVAKVGQNIKYRDRGGAKILTEAALKNAQGTWKGGNITKNHGDAWDNFKILDEKLELPFLFLKMDSDVEAAIKSDETTGVSVEVNNMGLPGEKLENMIGTGLSILWDRPPACNAEMGCASITNSKTHTNSKTDFDLAVLNNQGALVKIRDIDLYLDKNEMKDGKLVKDQLLSEVAYLGYETNCVFLEHNPSLRVGDIIPSGVKTLHTIQIVISGEGIAESEYHKGGGINKMGKEGEDPVTFTEGQAKAMVASAVAEVTEKLDNAHTVATTDLEKANTTKIEELETEHAKIVKEAENATTKLKEQIETELRGEIKTKLGMSDEVAKTLDVFSAEQLTAMKGWTMPTVATAAAGISSAAGKSSEAPKEEVLGPWDPVKGEFGKAYRRGE